MEKIGDYIISAGGKRLRPLLVLLAGKTLGYKGDDLCLLAATIEFLHTSTLLHDDVVDASGLRRGRSTANALWGNAPSVLVGDFLYARSFEMMVELGSMPVMRIISQATRVIAEGEVLQLSKVRDASTTEETYMEVIRGKTAMLFEASTHSAAALCQAGEEQSEALRRFGDYLGIAFQLVDDLLDYRGDAATLGKNVGDDLAEGKPTLPLIVTMRDGTEEQAALVRKAIQQGGSQDLESVCAAVEAAGALTIPPTSPATTPPAPSPAWIRCRTTNTAPPWSNSANSLSPVPTEPGSTCDERRRFHGGVFVLRRKARSRLAITIIRIILILQSCHGDERHDLFDRCLA